jgi:hypothetical protein
MLLKMLKKFLRSAGLWAAPVLAVALLLMGARGEAAESGVLHLRCTNPVGGANWPIVIDLGQGLVDSLPAKITEGWISWREPGGGVYELERATGNLRLRAASSTGGFFLHYVCRPE